MNLGHRGLALSTGGVATINFLALYILMRRETGALETRAIFSVLGKLFIASTALGGVCVAAQTWVLVAWSQHGFAWQTAMLFMTIGIAGAVFFVVARLLRITELDDITEALHRKLGRRFSRA
jgi:peptidoglycan biosynthesis protein MviN/MurJ (putative lipid II flippase)